MSDDTMLKSSRHALKCMAYGGAATLFALAVGFQSAYAAPPQNEPSLVVHFADLDLSRSEGITALYQRVKGAAETVCAPLDDRDLARQMSFRACVQSAISSAATKIDVPAWSAYHAAKTPGLLHFGEPARTAPCGPSPWSVCWSATLADTQP